MSSHIVFEYSRAQAIEDGVLIDATTLAKEAGFRYSVALTRAAWETCVTVPPAADWQSETGRLWDILMMLRFAIRSGGQRDHLSFVVHVQNDRGSAQSVTLKSICGPGDDLSPVLTIMMPDED